MFQHMDVETELLKRTQAEGEEQTAGSDSKPSKYPRPAMKGSAGSGKGGTVSHQTEAPPTETEDPLAATAAALAPRTAAGNQDWKANAGAKDKEAETSQLPRGNRQQGWQNSSGPRGRRGWGSQNWGGQGQRRSDKAYDQALEENVKLLARLCLRHEDELSQMRVERDFVITMETQEAAVLSKLYRLSTVWKEKKEKGEVDCSLRLALFLGLCQVWLERLRALEADTAEAKALRERIMELGQAFIPEGQTELHWWYMKWDPTTSTLMKLADVEPLKQSQIVNSLVELQQVISAPTVLQRFHSTRRMSSTYEGETVTFLLSVGLRDPKAAQAWGLLNNLCGNSSGKVIGLRMRPTRMDRQPMAKVVAERFPPPAPRRRETQQRGGMEQDEAALKQVEESS